MTVAKGGDAKHSLIDACNAALTASKLTPLSASLAGLDTTCNPISSKLTTDPGGLQFQGLFPVDTSGTAFTDLVSTNAINGGLGKVEYAPQRQEPVGGNVVHQPGRPGRSRLAGQPDVGELD